MSRPLAAVYVSGKGETPKTALLKEEKFDVGVYSVSKNPILCMKPIQYETESILTAIISWFHEVVNTSRI